MNTYQLGIDVAKAKLDGALRLPDGKLRHKVVVNSLDGFEALKVWWEKQGTNRLHVCMEATGLYWEAVAEFLAAFEYVTVSVVNPAQIKAFGASRMVRTKTGKADAKLIAEFCAERCPTRWPPPSPAEQTRRAMVLRLESLHVMHTQESNRLAVARPSVKNSVDKPLQWLDQEIAAISKAIRDPIDNDPSLRDKRRLLDSIPGVGERTIAVLLAFMADTQRFGNARQAVAFAGLDPRQHESGRRVKAKPRLSKVGHAFLRKMLYMPAMVAVYRTQWGAIFRRRLEASGKPPMLIIGAMMRKLIHVAFGILKSEKPFNPTLHGA